MTSRSVSEKSKDRSVFKDRTRGRTTYTRSQCTSELIRFGVDQCATRPGSAGVPCKPRREHPSKGMAGRCSRWTGQGAAGQILVGKVPRDCMRAQLHEARC